MAQSAVHSDCATLSVSMISWMIRLDRVKKRPHRLSGIHLSTIDGIERHEFEKYTVFLLKQIGFSKIAVAKTVGDQRIDVIALKARLKYGGQCKRWKINAGSEAVRKVFEGQSF